jgi:hypothetical protein
VPFRVFGITGGPIDVAIDQSSSRGISYPFRVLSLLKYRRLG